MAARMYLRISLISFVCASWAVPSARAQNVWFVDDDAPPGGNGATWDSAYKYLLDALAQATDSDEIRVAGGIYNPDRDEAGHAVPGDRNATFQLVNGVSLRGGYAGLSNPENPDERNIVAYETLLSGDLNGDDETVGNGENSYHVVTGSGTGPSAVLDGLTITAGYADGTEPDDRGAGIYNYTGSPTLVHCTVRDNSAVNSGGGMANRYDSSPTLSQCTFIGNSTERYGAGMQNWSRSNPILNHCTFRGNSATLDGGGLYNGGDFAEESSPTLTSCTFDGNSASAGGGIVNYNGDPTLIDCTFSDNVVDYGGGGMFNWRSNATLINCTFRGNWAGAVGGGMGESEASNPTLVNCLFSGNWAGLRGGAVYNYDGRPTLANCTFAGNSSADDGGGLYNEFGPAVLSNCVLWGNSDSGGTDESAQIHVATAPPLITYTCIQGLDTFAGDGNIGLDPLLADPDGADDMAGTEDDEFHLLYDSPCIDAADNQAVPADTLDLDADGDTSEPIPSDFTGRTRFFDDPDTPDTGSGVAPIVDMGAYEFQDLVCLPVDPPSPAPTPIAKNRYLSFAPGDSARHTALRVVLTDLPDPFEELEGETFWLGEPFPVSVVSGSSGPTPEPTFVAAGLQCDPHYRNWSTIDLVYVFGDAIVPGGSYGVQAIHTGCDTAIDSAYSVSLNVAASAKWGDITGDCSATPCSPPDGQTDFIDITVIVDKFKETPGSTHKSRGDLVPSLVDLKVDFLDISSAVGAFRGEAYPFTQPDPCP